MTKRIITIDLDTPIGNKLYWFLKIIMEKFSNEIKEIEQQFGVQMIYASYLLFKPEIETADICHNANSTLCKKCFESECELAGRDKK